MTLSSAQTASPDGARARQLDFKGPLRGLKVIDAGTMIAGPLCTTLLADFGADVIKIELPGVGDSMRHWAPMKDDQSLWWKVIGRNKRLITLKLSSAAGVELFKRLVRDADVVVENYRPGTFERWGLGYDVLSRINPRLILVRVSGFGQTGAPTRSGGAMGPLPRRSAAFRPLPAFPTGRPHSPDSPWPIRRPRPFRRWRRCSRSTIVIRAAGNADRR